LAISPNFYLFHERKVEAYAAAVEHICLAKGSCLFLGLLSSAQDEGKHLFLGLLVEAKQINEPHNNFRWNGPFLSQKINHNAIGGMEQLFLDEVDLHNV
jgi:hypothetical protein